VSPNVAHSVHQRLLNLSRAEGRPFQELLHHFMLERFLYRLGQSTYRDRFVLKGALMLRVWHGVSARATRDIDLLGLLSNEQAAVADAIRGVCQVKVTDDGVEFVADSVTASRITADGVYEGVRITFSGLLGSARTRMQLDVGFGDSVVPGPSRTPYPVRLDFAQSVLLTYSRESAVAEKLSAMLRLGTTNSRMKDYFDIWLLSRESDFDGAILAEAIRRTLHARAMPVPEAPVGLTSEFAATEGKSAQWQGFVRKSQTENAPTELADVVSAVSAFLSPVLEALASGEKFISAWRAPGGWQAS